MLTNDMLSILCCPTCRIGELRAEIEKQEGNQIQEGNLICDTCNVSYPVQVGIPDLMPHGVLTSAEYQMWKDHLVAFRERREYRIKEPNRFVNRQGKDSKAKQAFSQLINIADGKFLDVGCGAGKFRFHLNNNNVTYYGLDPVIVPGIESFPFARALAEYIPFKNDTFSNMVITAALDHFQDLDKFCGEAIRVLQSNGKLHIMQSIHEIKGPKTAVKAFAHWAKETIENRATKIKSTETPRHMSVFSKSSLFECLSNYFEIMSVGKYSHKWYSPTIAFLSLCPKE